MSDVENKPADKAETKPVGDDLVTCPRWLDNLVES
jgi:hypothetical protein